MAFLKCPQLPIKIEVKLLVMQFNDLEVYLLIELTDRRKSKDY